ncbi:MAG: 50S ribosomal protein L24 [Christensenellales bacterium]|jgi:large subunit ribosomal protein L24
MPKKAQTAHKMHVKKDDTVVVISGKDRGKMGKVLVAEPKVGKVIVEGVNIATKHKKARSQAEQGGIIRQEAPIYASKVMVYCDSCKKATRRSVKVNNDGTRVRVCKHCGKALGK